MRSLLGMWGNAIAVWDVGSAIAFGVWECDRFLGCGDAIAFGMLGVRSLFGNVGCNRCLGMWRMCDRYLGCGDAIAIWGCGGCAIAVFGMWGLRLKLGALMTVTKRRVLIAINSSCPYQHIYATAYRCLQLLPNPG